MPGATNTDKDRRHPDVIQGSHSDLPFEDGTLRTVHAVNPFGFNPVNAETARVMERGGLPIVSAAQRNKFREGHSGGGGRGRLRTDRRGGRGSARPRCWGR
ncbi:hypothetical protein GCM10017752_60930 [Streptomyces roseoviridis]